MWISLAGLVYFIEPDTFGATPLFFVLVFFALLFMFALVFADRRRGLIASTSLTFFLLLAYLGVGNILNLILIIAIATSVELYFSLK